MKVVRINHDRCNEWDVTTYALAPDEWSNGEVMSRVGKAQDEYQQTVNELAKVMKETPPGMQRPFSSPQYKNYPDKTVREVDELHAEQVERYKAYEAEKRKGYRSFSSYLEDQGFTRLDNYEDAVVVEVYWGHQHGTKLDYRDDALVDVDGPVNPDPRSARRRYVGTDIESSL